MCYQVAVSATLVFRWVQNPVLEYIWHKVRPSAGAVLKGTAGHTISGQEANYYLLGI